MHQPSVAPILRPELRYPKSTSMGLQIAIQRANTFFPTSTDIRFNHLGHFVLEGKWPSDLDTVSNCGPDEFLIIANTNGVITGIEEKNGNKFAGIEIHSVNSHALAILFNRWADEQITKSSPTLFPE